MRLRWFVGSLALLALCPSLVDAGNTLPIYPHCDHGGQAREPVNPKYINQAVSQGSTASLYTNDSVGKVDAWYKTKLPKSCTHTSTGQYGTQYHCGDRWVTIVLDQGRTSIVLGPSM